MLIIIASLSLYAQQQQGEGKVAVIMHVSDAIGPAISDYIHRGLQDAVERNAAIVILRLDTPGGLDTAMRDIIRDIIASPVPVVTYVAPPGARAASAGTYILYASHIAVMAPGTNLGAATPVQLGGGFPGIKPPKAPDKEEEAGDEEDKIEGEAEKKEEEPALASEDAMTHKMINDSVAYIRSLAEMRGRNADWAEKAVREAASLSSEQALQQGVIDIVADDIDNLLKQLDGWHTTAAGQSVTLDTEGLVTETFNPDWRTRILSVITNPNVAYILMLLGIYGLFFELANPGFVLPGVIGAICLLLALYSMQVLPVNYAGLGLIILGIIFMIAEIFAPSFGALGIGGVIAFVVGSVILFDTESSHYQVAVPIIVGVTIVSSAFFIVAMRLVFAAHKKPVVTGMEEMVGSIGKVVDDFDQSGRVYVHGEYWNASTKSSLKKGDQVRVTAINGLVLCVEPVNEEA